MSAADTAEAAKRFKNLQNFTEEWTQANENCTSLQELEQLREISEFRVRAAVSEESYSREQACTLKARKSACAELEQRWRTLLNEERTLRNREHDALALRLVRCEDSSRAYAVGTITSTDAEGSIGRDLKPFRQTALTSVVEDRAAASTVACGSPATADTSLP